MPTMNDVFKGRKVKLTLELADLRADIDDQYEEGEPENERISEILDQYVANGEEIELEIDPTSGDVRILKLRSGRPAAPARGAPDGFEDM